DPAARPDGLERFLVRAGFQVTEAPYPPPVTDRSDQTAPDLLIFAVGARDARLAEAVRALATAPRFSAAPVIVLVADGGAGVVAVYENPAIRDLRVELERYPEIQEAIRTERPVIIHDVREHPLFDTIRRHWVQQAIEVNVQSAVALPVFVQGRAAGVFFLRTV